MKVLHTIRDTPPNPNGLCALSINNDNCYLAYPGSSQIGEVQIFDCVNLVSNCNRLQNSNSNPMLFWIRNVSFSKKRSDLTKTNSKQSLLNHIWSLQRAVTMIAAHDNPLAALAFNSTGTKIATASEKVEIDWLLFFQLYCVPYIIFGEDRPHFSFTETISLSSAEPSIK